MYALISLMSFGLIGISSSSLLLSLYNLILFYFLVISFSFSSLLLSLFASFYLFLYLEWKFFIFWCIEDNHITFLRFILWHWFGDFILRGCIMGEGSHVHQWLGRAWFIPNIFLLEFDLLMIKVCTFIQKIKIKTKKEKINK